MEEKMGMYDWLTIATRGIRFKPDREVVRAELREHLEDKMDDLMRIFPDLLPGEAEERALREMGEPEEIGKELAKIHKPWLGWLWRVSQVALWIVAAILLHNVVSAASVEDYLGGWYHSGPDLEYVSLDSIMGPAEIIDLKPWEGTVEVDGHRITMEQALLKEWEDETRLAVVLRCWSPRFWERYGNDPRQRMAAMDDLGNYYRSYSEFWEAGDIEYYKHVIGEPGGNSPLYRDYVIWVYEVDHGAREMTLEYDWLGRSFSMTIDLEEVVRP